MEMVPEILVDPLFEGIECDGEAETPEVKELVGVTGAVCDPVTELV